MPNQQGILVFDLDSPEGENSFQIATKAMDYTLAWRDLEEEIRQMLKYGNQPKAVAKAFEQVRDCMIAIENKRELVRVL